MAVVWIVFLVFALLIAFFAAFNASPVDVNLMVWKTTAPLSLVIVISAVAGAVLSAVLFLPRQFRGFWQVRELRGKVRRLEGELRNYKDMEARSKQEAAASSPVGSTGSTGSISSTGAAAPSSPAGSAPGFRGPSGAPRGNEPRR